MWIKEGMVAAIMKWEGWKGKGGVTVEAGTFPDAWRLLVDPGSGFEMKQWLASHVGLVKMSSTGEPQSGYKVELHNELVSSDVKE